MRTLLAVAAYIVLSAVQGNAEITVKEYKAAIANAAGGDAVKLYIKGLGEGIGWANIRATTAKMPLFCPPGKLALGLENFIDIIDRQIEAQAKGNMPQAQLDGAMIGLVLLVGFQETFPCTSK